MNNFGLALNPLFPYWAIALLVLMFLFFIWKEIKRKQRLLGTRILAQLVILISLMGILLRPSITEEKKSGGILLLTPGYTRTSVDSLLTIQSDLRIIKIAGVDYSGDSEVLNSLYDLPELSNKINYVLGNGLPAHALELMSSKFQFIPSSLPDGVVKLELPDRPVSNQPAQIRGVINTTGKTTLSLYSAGGREDSVIVSGKGSAFELNFLPKQSGTYTYTLKYNNDGGQHTEHIAVEIVDEQKLNILFLQNSPDFELRQLKNFLAERKHKLTLRYQLSKNNYRVEFANTPSVRISPLTATLLNGYDLIILNIDALESLTTLEKNILEKAIHEGLGLIIIQNRATDNEKLRTRFFPIPFKKALKDTCLLTLPNKQYTLPVIPLEITDVSTTYPASKNRTRTLSAYTYSGAGKVGVQFLQETYRIALEGNLTDYATIWSPLIEKTARTSQQKFKIQVMNSFPIFPQEPISIDVVSAVDEHPTVKDGHVRIPLIEHPAIDNLCSGTTWASEPGWHQLSAEGTATNYFVSEPSAWHSLRIANQQVENKAVSKSISPKSSGRPTYHPKTIPAYIYFLLFIFAAGYLWLAPKL